MATVPQRAARRGTPEPDLSPKAREIVERMARCAYMIDRHREGIALNSKRIADLQVELRGLEQRS